jgi:hypothetical protein
MKPVRTKDAKILEAAMQVTQKQEAKTITVPEIDFKQFYPVWTLL